MNGLDFAIRQAAAGDLEQIVQLLADVSLPTAGVEDHLIHFLVAENVKEVVAVIGMERSGIYGLLRSLAVSPRLQKQGIARALVTMAINHAQASGISELFLLTETAANYLSKFGFTEICRAEIPETLLNNSALNSACSCCSTCMRLKVK